MLPIRQLDTFQKNNCKYKMIKNHPVEDKTVSSPT